MRIKRQMRNGFIDVQKFCYALVIVIFHFYERTHEHFEGGGTAVEFFLITSGVFFFAGYRRNTVGLNHEELLNYPGKYIRERLLRFFPYTIPAFIFAFLVRVVITGDGTGINSVPYIIDSFVNNIWEIPLMSMCGVNANTGMLNGVTWTISAMLIAEFVILNFLVRGEKTFCSFLAPIAMLVGCGFWVQEKDLSHVLWHGFTTFGVIRAFIMTCLGIYTWKCAQWLSDQRLTNRGQVLLTTIELSLHMIAITSMMYRSNRYYRLFCALLFAAAITITISQQSYTARWLKQTKVTNFLGEWSMTIYVVHQTINILLYRYFESPHEYYRQMKYGYGVLVVLVSIALLYFARWINHMGPKVVTTMRGFFTGDDANSKTQE